MMNNLYKIKPLTTLGWWIAASFIVFPMTVLVTGILAIPTFMIANLAYETVGYGNDWLGIFGSLMLVPLFGAILGANMAFLQRKILRKRLYWVADHWYRWTVIGGAVGACVAAVLASFFQFHMIKYFGDNAFVFLMPTFLTVVSAFQMIALRQAVKQAWMWIIGNLVGGIVFAGIVTSNQPSYYDPNSEFLYMLYALFSVLALGTITGMVILFLFETQLLPMQTEDKTDASKNGTSSVWDKAI